MMRWIGMPPADCPDPLDEFLPVFDVSDTVACTAAADAEHCWRARTQLDLHRRW